MKNRIWIGVILCCLLVAICPLFVKAEARVLDSQEWQGGPLTWTVYDNGTLEISGSGDFEGAQYYPWRAYYKDITQIVIGDGVTSIPNGAFSRMYNLKSVTIGKSVKLIDKNVFSYCASLESVHIPASVKKIGTHAFVDCASLKQLTFDPDSNLQRIDWGAFGNTAIQTLTLPKHVKYIGTQAFRRCTDLRVVRLNDELEEMENVFTECRNIRYVYVGKSLINISPDEFRDCTSLEYFENNSKTSFPHISDMPNLKTVVIGGDLDYLSGFENCPNLSNVVITGKVMTILEDTFSGCPKLVEIDLPDGLEYIGRGAFCGSGLKGIVLPDSVREIGGSFSACNNLAYAVCGSNLHTIGAGSFSECKALEYVDLKHTKILKEDALTNNPNLTKIVWSDELQRIDREAFEGTNNLPAIVIPPTVTEIHEYAFGRSEMDKFVFLGDAPAFDSWGLLWFVEATVYYPADNPTWTKEMMESHEGKLTWAPICTEHIPKTIKGATPTCERMGWTDSTICEVCGLTLQNPVLIAAEDHKFADSTVDPACNHCGYVVHTCKTCGYEYADEFQGSLTHDYTEWERFSEESVTRYYKRECKDCDYSVYIELQEPYAPPQDPAYEKPKPTTTRPTTVSTRPTQTQPTTTVSEQPTTEPVTLPPTSGSTTTVPATTVDETQQQIDPLVEADVKAIAIMLLAIAGISLATMGILIYVKLTKKDEEE
jgi:hypothetical protein